MGFVIYVPMKESANGSSMNDQALALCEGILERDGYYLYIPLSGKLIDVLRILAENNISYEIKSDPPEVSIT